jgi:NodT family efflux transporter outer membrane factor (OMF) lipoprotein
MSGMLALIYACAVGPKYTRPEAVAPPAYKEGSAPGQEGAPQWKEAQPGDATPRGNWWSVYNDPTLDGLEEKIEVSNQRLSSAAASFRQARAQFALSRAGYAPTVSAGASTVRSRTSAERGATGTATGVTFNDTVLSLDLSYEVDLWGRVRSTVAQSGAAAQASAADLEGVRLSLQAELAVDLFTARALDSEREILDRAVAGYAKALELTTNRYDAGIAAKSDVALAETQLQSTRAQAIDLDVQRAQVEHAIATLVGQPASQFSLERQAILGEPPPVPAGVPSDLLERRPDIAGAERRVAAANAGIGVARSAYFPSLSLTGSGGYESSRTATLLTFPARFWSIGAALVETLFDGGRRRSASQQAVAVYDQSVADYRESVLQAIQEVEDNLAALRILDEEATVQDAAVQAAGRSLDLSINRYKGGIATYLEVVTVQAATLADERAAVDILERRMIASVLLIKALGGGWDAAHLPALQDLRGSTPPDAAVSASGGR